MTKFIFFFVFTLISLSAHSKEICQHNSIIRKIMNKVSKDLTKKGFRADLVPFEDLNCREWPYKKDFFLATRFLAKKTDEQEYQIALIVAIIDLKKKRLLSVFKDSTFEVYDAVKITSVDFDVARYNIIEGNRAFGIRVHKNTSTAISSSFSSTLSLFLPMGVKLLPILYKYPIEENLVDRHTDCNSNFEDTTRTIAVAKEKNKFGFSNLIVRTLKHKYHEERKNGKCVKVGDLNYSKDIKMEYPGFVEVED